MLRTLQKIKVILGKPDETMTSLLDKIINFDKRIVGVVIILDSYV